MTRELIERSRKRQALADVGLLVTTAALVLSLAVAFTAVSIGIARADTLAPFANLSGRPIVLAVIIAVTAIVIGRLIAAAMRSPRLH